jgi:hypothetical protein
MLVLGAILVEQGRVGAWAIVPGLLRYLLGVAARLLPWLNRPLPASDRRRWICAFLGVALALATSPTLPGEAAQALVALGLAAVGYSFARDVAWLDRQRRAAPVS